MVMPVYLKTFIAVALGAVNVRALCGPICANIVFGVDTSCDISDDTKNGVKEFMEKFVGMFNDTIADPKASPIRVSQFGLLAFDSSSRIVIGFEDGQTKYDVINKINDFDHTALDCKTSISEAINMAIADFFESGDDDDRSPNVLVLFTTGDAQPNTIDDTKDSINRLRAKNNTFLFLVPLTNKNGKTELYDVVDPKNIFPYSEDINVGTVYTRIEEISRCPRPFAPGNKDVLIILDHSKSFKPEHKIVVRDALKTLIGAHKKVGDGEAALEFAIIAYNNKVETEMLFNNTMTSTRAGILAAIDNISITHEKNRRTDLALEFANDVVFRPDTGDRPFANNVIILITSGPTIKAKYQKNTIKAANALKSKTGTEKVTIFLLALPGARPKNVAARQREWDSIASEPKDRFFKSFENINELSPFMPEIAARVCAIGL
ncbi:unnamed protein product [Owenia fusiformis]|uniref:Uncharacterized protein n=1 Tax=Owenia fusiformis TaxID=6347 RepID=A0A8J1TX01_OWEFU|nr:unnamed protein product [Owenia fusiformis]